MKILPLKLRKVLIRHLYLNNDRVPRKALRPHLITSLRQMFAFYPYKKLTILDSGEISKNKYEYFPKKYLAKNDRKAVSFKEFDLIIRTYLKHVFNQILGGREFVIPRGLGMLKLMRKKAKVKVKDGKIEFPNRYMGYMPSLVWSKYPSNFAHSYYWVAAMQNEMQDKLLEFLDQDPYNIYNFEEVTNDPDIFKQP